MDTKFWGPSGWKFLHLITFSNAIESKSAVRCFFETLPYVLPCKFCRQSLSEYVKKIPLDTEAPAKWLWKIHNCVNGKLRSQNLNSEPDPPFSVVKRLYTDKFAAGCTKTTFDGWDFLFSVADLHPMSATARKSVPMPGAPLCDTMRSDEEKNKWNCLTPKERIPYYRRFWVALGPSLPFKEWRTFWANKKTQTKQLLWKTRCAMETKLYLLNRCKYSSLCKTLKLHRSGCNKSKRARTCRKEKRKNIQQR